MSCDYKATMSGVHSGVHGLLGTHHDFHDVLSYPTKMSLWFLLNNFLISRTYYYTQEIQAVVLL